MDTKKYWQTRQSAANKQGYHIIRGNTDEYPEKQEVYLRSTTDLGFRVKIKDKA